MNALQEIGAALLTIGGIGTALTAWKLRSVLRAFPIVTDEDRAAWTLEKLEIDGHNEGWL